MAEHLFPNFLKDEQVYLDAERHWIELWDQVDTNTRVSNGWTQPWFQPLPPSISEGNPIFSAVPPRLRRGIRIIQSAPTDKGLEFVAYLDTFGGSVLDPDAIHELVISCALSDEAASVALSLIGPWVEGKAICFDAHEAGWMASDDFTLDKKLYADVNLLSETGVIPSIDWTDEETGTYRRAG